MTPTHAPAPPRTRPTGRDVTRGLLASAALIGFILGVPAALLTVAPLPLAQAWPTGEAITTALTRPDDGTLLLAAITVIAWAAWAAFTASVIAEIAAAARHVHPPRLPLLGPAQHLAATLVTTAGLLLASAAPLASAASAHPTITAVTPTAPANHPATSSAPGQHRTPPPDTAAPSLAAHSPTGPVVTVTRGDTLWGLAERYLGDGHRYTEIVDLNLGRPQPDGRTLTDTHWLYPGWQLRLPPDAHAPTPTTAPPATHTPATAGGVHTVVPGDTLWEIADTHLDDPTRYPEIAALNHGITQADGHALTDPDRIEPGWTLTLPADAPDTPPPAPTPDRPHTVPAPSPTGPTTTPPPPDDANAPVPDDGTVTDDARAATEPDTAATDAGLHGRDDARAATDDDHPTTTGQPDDEADDADDADDADASTQHLFFGLTALAAAGVIGELTRRRALQHRTRRVGQRIPLPAAHSPAADAERTLRSAAPPVTIPTLKQALLNLASRCYTAERDLPRLAAISLTPDSIALHLADDDTQPVLPFDATDPRTWTTTHTALSTDGPIEDPDRPEPFPVLVTLGHTTDATVLLNLEAAGTLTLSGDGDGPADVLRALVAELATSDLTGRIGLVAEPHFAALAGACTPARLQIATPNVIADQLAHRHAAIHEALRGIGTDDTLQARSDRVVGDVWLPVVYVTSPTSNTPPWSGTAVIGLGEPDTGGWSIRVHGDRATLEPLHIDLQPQRLSASDFTTLATLLATAAAPTDTHPNPATRGAEGEVADALAALHPAANIEVKERAAFRINVLGPIAIEGLPSGDTLSRRSTELLVYLALRGQATGPELDEALWHGLRIDNQTRNSLVYRTRQRVGPDILPTVDANGVYRLGDTVACDWTEFQHHARRGLQAMPDDVGELQVAMNLVRDRPLLGVPDAGYTWAEYDIQHMISTIADTAHVLARAHAQRGDHRAALTTATKGLLVDNSSAALHLDAIQAAENLGDHAQAARLTTRYESDLEVLDPDLV